MNIQLFYTSWLVQPFIRFSLGYAINSTVDFQGHPPKPTDKIAFSGQAIDSFGYGAGVGVVCHFDWPVQLSLEYDYFALGDAALGAGVFFPTVPESKADRGYVSKRDMHAVLFSILYKI